MSQYETLAVPKIMTMESIQKLQYLDFPEKSTSKAAMVEWGNSAVISALDATVASFGPQISDVAFFEVETIPILADPVDGVGAYKNDDQKETESPLERLLDNSEEVLGSMLVMTNEAGLSGVQMAKIAKDNGAVALMVVNMDQNLPDYAYSLMPESEEEARYAEEYIDIPVVMVSLASGNQFTTVTVTEDMKEEDIVNNGMPESVRMYGLGERPFFEDTFVGSPALYLIHNILTPLEADKLISETQHKLKNNQHSKFRQLEPMFNPKDNINVDYAHFWKGNLKSHSAKEVDERIAQITGYSIDQISDWNVARFNHDSFQNLHRDFDHMPNSSRIPIGTITVFLNDIHPSQGGEIVFPDTINDQSIKVLPRKGLAVFLHTLLLDEDNVSKQDPHAIYAHLPFHIHSPTEDDQNQQQPKYIAQKVIYSEPIAKFETNVLPLIATLCGGALPSFLLDFYDVLVVKYGHENGDFYFAKIVIILPVLLLVLVISPLISFITNHFLTSNKNSTSSKTNTTNNNPTKKKKKQTKCE